MVRKTAIKTCLGILLAAGPAVGWARTLECPEGDAVHHVEITATSAPEVKVRSGSELRSMSPSIKPLTIKALRMAHEQRSEAMQHEIEDACAAPQLYVGEIPSHRSGCETRVATRPADGTHLWAQVIAICSYDWTCCAPGAGKGAVGYSIEGPLGVQPSSGTAQPPANGPKPAK